MNLDITCDAEYLAVGFSNILNSFLDKPLTKNTFENICLNLQRYCLVESHGDWGDVVYDNTVSEIAIHIFRADLNFCSEMSDQDIKNLSDEYFVRAAREEALGRLNISEKMRDTAIYLEQVIIDREKQ